jgi:oxygen-dependent protoporphyrinogen oxidase
MKAAIVIGAGISGIAAALALVERGFETQIFESELFSGGRIGTRRHENVDIDLGGRNFTANDVHLLGLLSAFGVTEVVDYRFNSVSVGVRRPFDMRSGGHFLEKSLRFLRNATSAGPLELLRVQRTASKAQRQSASTLGAAFWTQLAERSGDPPASTYFGRTISDQVLRPWTLRMMASEPEEVFLGNLGPLLGRQLGTLKRVVGGMGVFLRAVCEKLVVKCGHRVRTLLSADERMVGVAVSPMMGARSRHEQTSSSSRRRRSRPPTYSKLLRQWHGHFAKSFIGQ